MQRENWASRSEGRYSERAWRAYAGVWHRMGGRDPAAAVESEIGAVRLFRLSDAAGTRMSHKNLYTEKFPFGSPRQRPDGLWEDDFAYAQDDNRFQPLGLPSAAEAAQGIGGHQARRLLTIHPDAYLSCAVALPMRADTAAAAGAAPGQGGSWGFEAFLLDEPFRWSLAKIWGLADGAPLRYTLITERVAPVDPDASVDLAQHAMPPLRDRLSPDPSKWLPGSTAEWGGIARALGFDADGRAVRLAPVRIPWEPPAAKPGCRLACMPDGFWVSAPESLPAADELAASGLPEGVAFEFGGRLRSEEGLQRVVLRYDGAGRIERLTWEKFTRCSGL
ncbi:hypothetical protein WJX81_006999 [Elliptochloris bilobata]|uniref:DUF3598 domain-containing protein n=1 Tax=Elliptochloris bilobata TaxID=381761 RepID=A0AAW1RRT4_9CHLO